jgi:hypothetical protein
MNRHDGFVRSARAQSKWKRVRHEYFRGWHVESLVKDKNTGSTRPGSEAGKQFSFGAKRNASRRMGRLFMPQKCWLSPLFEFQPEATRSILRVVSKYS